MLTSPVEWGILAAVGLLLFGSKKFPALGRFLGEGIGNFKRSLNRTQEEFVEALEINDEIEKDNQKKALTKSSKPDTTQQSEQ
ncbi:MAG: twin-arginine translocase TatA/TatE family subunit [Candidatus Obscuribacterales bacterium]|nr:twin-arginine translocase TatA/TatE family subunit [Candidatus Obscuribacterales bacterium]